MFETIERNSNRFENYHPKSDWAFFAWLNEQLAESPMIKTSFPEKLKSARCKSSVIDHSPVNTLDRSQLMFLARAADSNEYKFVFRSPIVDASGSRLPTLIPAQDDTFPIRFRSPIRAILCNLSGKVIQRKHWLHYAAVLVPTFILNSDELLCCLLWLWSLKINSWLLKSLQLIFDELYHEIHFQSMSDLSFLTSSIANSIPVTILSLKLQFLNIVCFHSSTKLFSSNTDNSLRIRQFRLFFQISDLPFFPLANQLSWKLVRTSNGPIHTAERQLRGR
jgi:hypothetical protein